MTALAPRRGGRAEGARHPRRPAAPRNPRPRLAARGDYRVAFVGAIGFVGLVGPHIARLVVGEDQRFFLPVSALASATSPFRCAHARLDAVEGDHAGHHLSDRDDHGSRRRAVSSASFCRSAPGDPEMALVVESLSFAYGRSRVLEGLDAGPLHRGCRDGARRAQRLGQVDAVSLPRRHGECARPHPSRRRRARARRHARAGAPRLPSRPGGRLARGLERLRGRAAGPQERRGRARAFGERLPIGRGRARARDSISRLSPGGR